VHPLLGRARWFIGYLAAWAAAGVLLSLPLAYLSHRGVGEMVSFGAPLFVLYGGICLAAWWVCLARPLSEPYAALLSHLTAALLCATVWCVIATVWGNVLTRIQGSTLDRVFLFNHVIILFCLGVPLYLLSAAAAYLYLAIEDAHASEQRTLAFQVSAREAELRAVRSQLNPHFLFNSLNSINALVGSDPEGARRMCEGLGDFLRRTLQLGARDAVTLDDELALVDRYLAIEQVRFGPRLSVERAVSDEARACLLPPLLLQPLVENAIKHGVAERVEGGTVRLTAALANGALRIALENPVDEDARARGGEGLGLDIVRRRLEALGDAGLDARRVDGLYRVTLTLPVLGHD
jgi:sensor histidine kinase YesM